MCSFKHFEQTELSEAEYKAMVRRLQVGDIIRAFILPPLLASYGCGKATKMSD